MPSETSGSVAARDRGTEKLVRKVLGDPDLYPDELRAWIPKVIERNALVRLEAYQLPQVDRRHEVGASGEPAFSGAWTNYGGSNEVASFYRDPFGRVHLAGLVKSGAAGTTIFSLPGGYRPRARESFLILTGNPGDALGRVDVAANGDVIHVSGGTSYVQLNGISFRVS